MRLPKYSIYFLSFIIILKIIYLVVEIYYNGYLIEVISNPDVTTKILNNVEKLGHNISATGMTLLLTPFAYLLIKKISKNGFIVSIFVSTFMVISFFSFYSLFTNAMNYLVKSNSDKRYASYYVTLFKYGMLNNYMGYNTFIPQDHLQHLQVRDRVIISNMFLLTLIDTSLIDRLILEGKNVFTDLVIKRYSWAEYKKSEVQFKNEIEKFHKLYNEYIKKSRAINLEFAKVDNKDMILTSYQDFISTLQTKYVKYDDAVISYKNNSSPSNSEIEEYKRDLKKYFRYSKYTRAQEKYERRMQRSFGKYINPSRWLPKNKKYPTSASIRKVIREEAIKKWNQKFKGIPPNLSELQFYKHNMVKQRVIAELRKKGLEVSNTFNYSKKQYFDAYHKKIDKEFERTKIEFINKFQHISGKKIKFGLTYSQFMQYFKDDFRNKYGNKYGTILFNLVLKNKVSDFYEIFYKPYFRETKLSNYLLSKQDMDKKKNRKIGDNAIKYLYIPPFAIGMSILAGILNAISVVSILVFLVLPLSNLPLLQKIIVKLFFKIFLLSIIIYYPYKISQDTKVLEPYVVFNINNSKIYKSYIDFLSWLIIIEEYNFKYIYKYIK